MRLVDYTPGGTATVEIHRLGQSHLVLVDADTWDEHGHHRWCITANGYVIAYLRGNGRGSGKGRQAYLHRLILGLVAGDKTQADHIDGNRLDNRRANLRSGSQQLNLQNKPSFGKTSEYRGVCYVKARGKWKASGSGSRSLGLFDTEEEAAAVAHRHRLETMPFYIDR